VPIVLGGLQHVCRIGSHFEIPSGIEGIAVDRVDRVCLFQTGDYCDAKSIHVVERTFGQGKCSFQQHISKVVSP
jgi:hypothetical protein